MIGKCPRLKVNVLMIMVCFCFGRCIDDPGNGIHGPDGGFESISPYDEMYTAIQDGEGVFYGTTGNKVYRFTEEMFLKGDTQTVYRNDQWFTSGKEMVLDRNNNVVIAMQGYVIRLVSDGEHMKCDTVYQCEDTLMNTRILSQESNGKVWVVTGENRILSWDGNKIVDVGVFENKEVRVLFAEENGSTVVIMTENGGELMVHRIDSKVEIESFDGTDTAFKIQLFKDDMMRKNDITFLSNVYRVEDKYIIVINSSSRGRISLDAQVDSNGMYFKALWLPFRAGTFMHLDKKMFAVSEDEIAIITGEGMSVSSISYPSRGIVCIGKNTGPILLYPPTLKIIPLDSL